MKKNIIYTLCLLLSGALFMSSCEDMLEIDTTRVDNEFNDLTLNDSVYSVLGIIKSVQNIADRHVLLGELRGDLVVTNPGKAVMDIQGISNFEFDLNNPYLAVKDYYSIINNCNVFLARVDTTIERSNQKLMLREYVAVKSLRAWTYLQLAINYGSVPYFTEPVLTHHAATDIMAQPMKSRDEIVSLLIEDLTPYENPRLYPMPVWEGIKVGGLNMHTASLFMPIRALLGELHLWRGNPGDYRLAANYFYNSLMDTPVFGNSSTSFKFYDTNTYVTYGDEDFDRLFNNYSEVFRSSILTSGEYGLFGVPMESSTAVGVMSGLGEIFAPELVGAAQVSAAPGYIALSDRQVYTYYDVSKPADEPKYIFDGEVYRGDLRRYAVTGSQRDYENDTYYENIIGKHNRGSSMLMNGVNTISTSDVTDHVTFYRAEMLYLRFAEALLGMAAVEGIDNADLLAFVTLGVTIDDKKAAAKILRPSLDNQIAEGGLNEAYEIRYNYVPADTTAVVDADGNPVLNAAGGDSIIVTPAHYASKVEYDFSDMVGDGVGNVLEGNLGFHSRGSGNTSKNIYYAPTAENIAAYFGRFTEDTDSAVVVSEITRGDTIRYASALLLDELALEFCFEGNRFGDLIRFAKFAEKCRLTNWQNVLAKRVAGRAYNNKNNLHSSDYEYDNGLYNMLMNEQNWYLPLPGSAKIGAPEAEE